MICMLLINKLLSAGFELLIFSLVPACWWLITARKQISFAQWIGLKAIPKKNRPEVWGWATLTAIGLRSLRNIAARRTAVSRFLIKATGHSFWLCNRKSDFRHCCLACCTVSYLSISWACSVLLELAGLRC